MNNNKILGLMLASALSGCVGENYRRYEAKADCDRRALVCLRGDCYYCASADLSAARGCLKTHWYYQTGADPLADSEDRRPDIIRYGSDGVVTITMTRECSSEQEPQLRLER